MTVTHPSPTWHRVGEVPTPQLPPLGFSTALVVEVTGERVRDLVGAPEPPRPSWVLPGATSPGIHRVRETDAYQLHISGGALALSVVQARPYAPDSGAWTLTGEAAPLWEDAEKDARDPEHVFSSRTITEWSRRSRARMVRALAEIDYDSWEGDTFAMVTLTLPGEWRSVAPTGRHFKAALERFRVRYMRGTGRRWQVAWKLEFQARGAPHFHLLMKPPALVNGERFETWLSRAWAASVAHGDAAQRAAHERAGTNVDYGYRTTDPKRVAVYFLKHSAKTQDSKEYQHVVPVEWRAPGTGPGRFWGIAGLTRTRASVEVTERVFYQLRRELRKLHRSLRAKTALDRRRAMLAAMVGETWRRPTLEDLSTFGLRRDRLLRSAKGGGWVVLNDAPAVAYRMAVWLSTSGRITENPNLSEPQRAP